MLHFCWSMLRHRSMVKVRRHGVDGAVMMVPIGRALRCALMPQSSPARQDLIIYMNSGPIFHARHLTACYWKSMHSNDPFVASCGDMFSNKYYADIINRMRYHAGTT